MILSVTKLRQNLYQIIDEILETGTPVEIERKGQILKIIPDKKQSKWERLEKHSAIIGNPDDLVEIDWSSEWHGNNSL